MDKIIKIKRHGTREPSLFELNSLFLEEISACAAVHTGCVIDACDCVQSIFFLLIWQDTIPACHTKKTECQ